MPRNWFKKCTRTPVFPAALVLAWTLGLAGCGGNSPSGPARYVPVTLKAMGVGGTHASVSAAGRLRGISEMAGVVDGDTIPVTFTKAYLVVRDVRFKIAGGDDDADSTGGGEMDSTDVDDDNDSTGVDEDDDEQGAGWIRFHGPFVIDLLAGVADSLDTQMAPPGLYNRVQGHLRALRGGDWNASAFSFLVGSTVYLEGTVDGDGGGPFVWQSRIDNEFQVWGPFQVDVDTPATAFLTFHIDKWLRASDGSFLDPRLDENHKWIEWAIRHNIKIDIDDDHNGEPDDN
jgi:hypothetical protein